MIIRLLIIEPDEEVMESHLSYFHRTTDFVIESAVDADVFFERVHVFLPQVLMLEPAMPDAIAILDHVEVPVIVLSRFKGDDALRSHPAITEYFVKPKSLVEIRDTIEELARPKSQA